jgi:hypothetical protein
MTIRVVVNPEIDFYQSESLSLCWNGRNMWIMVIFREVMGNVHIILTISTFIHVPLFYSAINVLIMFGTNNE